MFDFFRDLILEMGGMDSVSAERQRKGEVIAWECICDCGSTIFVTTEDLINGSVKSCGCLVNEANVFAGQRFGKLTVVRRTEGGLTWQCKCDCGNTTFVTEGNLTSGKTTSCGCQMRERVGASQEELTGRRYGRLIVLRPVEDKRAKRARKKKERFIFSTGSKIIVFILGIIFLVMSLSNMTMMKGAGSLNVFRVIRYVFLACLDIASLVCLVIGKKKTEIAALIMIVIFIVTQYFGMLLM